jgi:hypothetical protein
VPINGGDDGICRELLGTAMARLTRYRGEYIGSARDRFEGCLRIPNRTKQIRPDLIVLSSIPGFKFR